jgi:hypothetical protein
MRNTAAAALALHLLTDAPQLVESFLPEFTSRLRSRQICHQLIEIRPWFACSSSELSLRFQSGLDGRLRTLLASLDHAPEKLSRLFWRPLTWG